MYQNELDKACFQLAEQLLIKYCVIRHLILLKIRNMDISVDLLQWSINFLTKKKTFGSGIENENISSKELTEELHKPIIRKFKKRKVHSSFISNVWGADITDMQLISKFNKGIRFLLCAIDIFSNMHWLFL